MNLNKILFLAAACFCCASAGLHAAYTLQEGRLTDVNDAAKLPVQEHFSLGVKAMNKNDWREASHQFNIVTKNFPNTPFGQESFYYLGVADYNLEEYDIANDAFSNYLKVHNNPKFFQSAIEYKYCIAEKFKEGAKRRFLGTKKLPKWASGASLALTIYDEVIAAMPCHEMAAQALYSKGCLQWDRKEYRESIESFQLIIRRFPKHELAPTCYALISKVYLDQSQNEFQNPDILAFAQINFRKFSRDFPKDERLAEVEGDVLAIKEVYAKGLYETGQFYERKKLPKASVIYYQSAIDQFPETDIAKLCMKRLMCLCPNYPIAKPASAGEDFELKEEAHS